MSSEERDKALALFNRFDSVLDFRMRAVSLESEIEDLIKQRTEARKSRNFAQADKIRDDLAGARDHSRGHASGREVETKTVGLARLRSVTATRFGLEFDFKAVIFRFVQAGVTQLVEYLICNQAVGGSNPFAGFVHSNKIGNSSEQIDVLGQLFKTHCGYRRRGIYRLKLAVAPGPAISAVRIRQS